MITLWAVQEIRRVVRQLEASVSARSRTAGAHDPIGFHRDDLFPTGPLREVAVPVTQIAHARSDRAIELRPIDHPELHRGKATGPRRENQFLRFSLERQGTAVDFQEYACLESLCLPC